MATTKTTKGLPVRQPLLVIQVSPAKQRPAGDFFVDDGAGLIFD
jgi:hypothetical protein